MQIRRNIYNFAVSMEITRHIEILLLTNDCVTVPGLGAFVAHHSSAYYDRNEALFLPPSRTIGFNSQLTMNDSLLAQSYVEAYDLSYPEAVRAVEKDVDELKNQLKENGIYEFHGIGSLSVNDDGAYVFTASRCGVLTPALYGLSSFDFGELSGVSANTAFMHAPLSRMASRNKPEKTITIRLSTLRDAAVAAVAVIAMILIPTVNKQHNDNQQASVLPTAIVDKAVNKATKADKDAKTATITNSDYTIVLASRVSKANGEAFIQILKDAGYNGGELMEVAGENMVILGHYATHEEAMKVVSGFPDTVQYKYAWVKQLK